LGIILFPIASSSRVNLVKSRGFFYLIVPGKKRNPGKIFVFHFLFCTLHCLLFPYCLLPIAYCLLPICPLPIAYCLRFPLPIVVPASNTLNTPINAINPIGLNSGTPVGPGVGVGVAAGVYVTSSFGRLSASVYSRDL